jgi:hypothetical protein
VCARAVATILSDQLQSGGKKANECVVCQLQHALENNCNYIGQPTNSGGKKVKKVKKSYAVYGLHLAHENNCNVCRKGVATILADQLKL